jgi:hypothetical protein
MTEHELRALVREAIAQRSGTRAEHTSTRVPFAIVPQHASHGLFVLPSGGEIDGPCLIEPAVACNHCGYCKSYGH